MDASEILSLLQPWADAINGMDAQLRALERLTGGMDGELQRAVDEITGGYTDSLVHTLGIKVWPAESGYTHDLDWYRFECDMGRRAREADDRLIESLEDFAAMIAEAGNAA